MAEYVDGFVIPIPKKNLASYKKMATVASKVWLDHGALEYRECSGDDLKVKGMRPFGDTVDLKAGETVVFSWITYKSRKHRDAVNAKVMKDPRLAQYMAKNTKMPFDMKRMNYGGFTTLVKA